MSDTVEAIGYKADVPTRTREAVTRRKDSIVDSVRNVGESVKSKIAGSGEGTSTAGGGRVSSIASTVGERTPSAQDMKQGARQAVGLAQENPLGLAIGSMAVGFLAGMLLPSTRMEDERIGPMADQVKQKAMETGQEALERGKQVAQETMGAATEAAQEAVQRTTETARESAQEQGSELSSSAQQKVEDVRSQSSS